MSLKSLKRQPRIMLEAYCFNATDRLFIAMERLKLISTATNAAIYNDAMQDLVERYFDASRS